MLDESADEDAPSPSSAAGSAAQCVSSPRATSVRVVVNLRIMAISGWSPTTAEPFSATLVPLARERGNRNDSAGLSQCGQPGAAVGHGERIVHRGSSSCPPGDALRGSNAWCASPTIRPSPGTNDPRTTVTDPISTSKSARESLARGLNALQADPSVPPALVELASPIAQAMGALHQIERTQQLAPHADVALNHLRGALAQLQTQHQNHPAVNQALEAVASSLSLVHALSRMANGPQGGNTVQPPGNLPPPPQVQISPPPAAAPAPPPAAGPVKTQAMAQ